MKERLQNFTHLMQQPWIALPFGMALTAFAAFVAAEARGVPQSMAGVVLGIGGGAFIVASSNRR